jgi:hypothetical protein
MSSKLRRVAKKILFEDVWQKYGSEYMSHPVGQGGQPIPDDDDPIAYGEVDLPVAPSDMMPNRIAIEKPPIDDEEYSPNNPVALSRALSAIGEEVPDSKVEDFYNTVKQELESLDTLSVEEDEEEPTEEEEEEEADEAELESELVGASGNMRTYESRIRKIIRDMILIEAKKPGLGPMRGSTGLSDWSQFKLGNHYQDDDEDDDEPEDWEIEAIEAGDQDVGDVTKYTGTKREIKGKYVAPYYGKSGDSGVTVGMQRLFANYLQHIAKVDDEDLQDGQDYISYHFVELDPTFDDPEVLRVLRTYIFKKIVKDSLKADKDVDVTFLPDLVAYVKRLRKRDMETLLQRARAEVSDEKRADAEFVELLKTEDPEQYKLFLQLFPSYAE